MDLFAGPCIQTEQTTAAVQENKEAAVIAPERGPTQLPAATRQNLAELVALAVEAPEFFAGLGVERCDVVVGSGHIQHAVDHQGRALEITRRGGIFGERRLPML